MKFFSSFKWNERAWNWILTCLISQCNDTKNGFSQLRHRMKNIKERHNNLQDVFCIRLRIPAFQFVKACYQRKKFGGISWAHSKLALLKDIVMCLSYLAQKKRNGKILYFRTRKFQEFLVDLRKFRKVKIQFPLICEDLCSKNFSRRQKFFLADLWKVALITDKLAIDPNRCRFVTNCKEHKTFELNRFRYLFLP